MVFIPIMKINSIKNLNFTANFIKKEPILKKDKNGNYQTFNVNFIEFDLKNKADVNKITDICDMPEFDSFGEDLEDDIVYNNHFDDVYYKTKRCYALVKETENDFQDIDKNNVLGIFSFYESVKDQSPNFISYFMTNDLYSNNMNRKSNKEYSEIGTGMVNALKKIYPNKSIGLYSAYTATDFWRKNGFKNKNEFYLQYDNKN